MSEHQHTWGAGRVVCMRCGLGMSAALEDAERTLAAYEQGMRDNQGEIARVCKQRDEAVACLDDDDFPLYHAYQDLKIKLAAAEQRGRAKDEALHAALDFIGNGYQPPELTEQIRAALQPPAKETGCLCRETCWTPEPCPIHGFKGPVEP